MTRGAAHEGRPLFLHMVVVSLRGGRAPFSHGSGQRPDHEAPSPVAGPRPAYLRDRTQTDSTCLVCGNMSTALTRSRR